MRCIYYDDIIKPIDSELILDNKINKVGYTENVNTFESQNIFRGDFKIYSLKEGISSSNNQISDYDDISENNETPLYVNPDGQREFEGANNTFYSYYKVAIKLNSRHLGKNFKLNFKISRKYNDGDIIQEENTIKFRGSFGDFAEYKFREYASQENFENSAFSMSENPLQTPYPVKVKIGDNMHIGAVVKPNEIQLFILLEKRYMSMLDTNARYILVYLNYNLDFYIDLMKNEQININQEEADFTLETNELFQNATLVDGEKLGDYLTNNIINHYSNGKQSVGFSVNVTDDIPLYKAGEIVGVMRCRRGDIDESDEAQLNKYSIARLNGKMKKFIITSAEFSYTGAYRQYLDMIENVEAA